SPGPADWTAQYAKLGAQDRGTPLAPTDLERLGIAAYMAGDEAASIDAHTRAHNLALANGDVRHAARSALSVAFGLIGGRELTRAAGWAARARRLLEDHHCSTVECGYVMLPQALQHIAAADFLSAEQAFAAAEAIGARFADADLVSLARMGRGR